jgi:hypothetical protein
VAQRLTHGATAHPEVPGQFNLTQVVAGTVLA